MNLDWYYWMLIGLLALLLAEECRAFHRDAKRAKFSLFNLTQIVLSLSGIIAILVLGART